jgi:putative tricarboxylic transport membrane protein
MPWLAISFPVTTLADHEDDWIDNIPANRLKRLLDSQTCPILFQRLPLDSYVVHYLLYAVTSDKGHFRRNIADEGGHEMKPIFRVCLLFLTPLFFSFLDTVRAWEPTKPIEFVIPAGTGGGADQMARLIAGIAEKDKLSPRPLIVVNKSGGAGAEGFLYVKGKKGDEYTIIITLSNLFTTPLATGTPFNWRDLTPVSRMALDRFILWVNEETPYKSAKEYLAAVKKTPGMKMGGTGSKQEDQIITVLLEQTQGVKFTYVPFKGGGEVCVNLVGNHVDSTVNNPIECVSHWKAKRVRPLAVFDPERIPDADWKAIPTVKEALGTDISYNMLRGIFGAPDMQKEAVDWYVAFLKKVFDSKDFQEYLHKGALKPAFATGPEYVKWVEENEKLHKELMEKGGLIQK